MLKKLLNKATNRIAILVATPVAIITTGLTSTNGVVTFEQADKDAIGEGFTNALSNLWAGFTTVLPYIGMAVGVAMVIGLAFKLIFKRA